MGRFIVKHTVDGKDLYQVWSTIVDAPITGAGTLDQIKNYWREEFGRTGAEDLERWIECRSDFFKTVKKAAVCNRAGKNETRLTEEQIIDYYFIKRGVNDPPQGKDWREIRDDED
jgi:hypothetical protein